jgi:hypothetical protein
MISKAEIGLQCPFASQRTRCGSDCSQRIESVTPLAISAQAFSAAERKAACSLLAETVLQADRP